MKRNLLYHTNIQLDPDPTQVYKSYTFALNSCYDPDYTGTGHSPMGFAELAIRYAGLYVVGAKMSLRFITGGTANAYPALYGIVISANATAPNYTSYDAFVEDQHRRGTIIGVIENIERNKRIIKWSAKKWFGKNVVGNTEYENNQGSGPGIKCFAHIYAFTVPGNTTNPPPIIVDVKLEQCIVGKEPVADIIVDG